MVAVALQTSQLGWSADGGKKRLQTRVATRESRVDAVDKRNQSEGGRGLLQQYLLAQNVGQEGST